MTHHLVLPPFDYVSKAPYIISVEMQPFVAVKGGSLLTAILLFFQMAKTAPSTALVRMIDARGTAILGLDPNSEVGDPCVVATNEALTMMNSIHPELPAVVEEFELNVRDVYVYLRGGT